MAKVIAHMSMSLDGFVSHPTDGVEHLFQWYGSGDVPVHTANPDMTFRVSSASAELMKQAFEKIGVLVYGRRTFEEAGGWVGGHPLGKPVIVVTHSVPDGRPRADTPLTFVIDGIESALDRAEATAGGKAVVIGSADLTQQCINLGLLDVLQIDLVPLLLGEGIRFLDHLKGTPLGLHEPSVVQGAGVTHLSYQVR